MIPVLYEAEQTTFTTQGIGALADAVTCTVEESRNGDYELELTYPVTGARYADLEVRRIITAIPSPYRSAQPFRIYKISKPMSGLVTVYARHLSYDLAGIPVMPFTAAGTNAALAGIKSNSASSNPFSFWSEIAGTSTFSIDSPTAARSCLGGVTGSVLDLYGGEYEWDGMTVKLYSARGKDSGVSIRYGKNLTELEQETDTANTVTGILPFWKSDTATVTCSPPVVYADGATYQKSIPVDFSTEFDTQPTPEQLRTAAMDYIKKNSVGVPSISTEISLVRLEQMSGYEDLKELEKCDLCDKVTVQHERLGVDVSAKIVKIRTNVLAEKYIDIQVGSVRSNIAQTISDQIQKLDGVVRNDGSLVAAKVAGLINGAKASLSAQYDAAEKTDVMAILFENLDNSNPLYGAVGIGTQGIQISKTRTADGTGWDWTTAITANGMIADVIVAGILSDKLGFNSWNLETGDFKTTRGEIGGWKISEPAIYKDVAAANGLIYRVYFQPPISTTPAKTWVLSCQKSTDNGQTFSAEFVLFADGTAQFGGGEVITDINEYGVTLFHDGKTVGGYNISDDGTTSIRANRAAFDNGYSGTFTAGSQTVTVISGIITAVN